MDEVRRREEEVREREREAQRLRVLSDQLRQDTEQVERLQQVRSAMLLRAPYAMSGTDKAYQVATRAEGARKEAEVGTPLSCYAVDMYCLVLTSSVAMRRPVLTEDMLLPGGERGGGGCTCEMLVSAFALATRCYTDLAYGATRSEAVKERQMARLQVLSATGLLRHARLRVCYTMPGTDVAYGAFRGSSIGTAMSKRLCSKSTTTRSAFVLHPKSNAKTKPRFQHKLHGNWAVLPLVFRFGCGGKKRRGADAKIKSKQSISGILKVLFRAQVEVLRGKVVTLERRLEDAMAEAQHGARSRDSSQLTFFCDWCAMSGTNLPDFVRYWCTLHLVYACP
eukprot:692728-Rhodomonas_salina.3